MPIASVLETKKPVMWLLCAMISRYMSEKIPQNHLVVWIKLPTFALEINNKTINNLNIQIYYGS